MKATLRRFLTNTSPLIDGFPCMTYTIGEKEYEKFKENIGKYNECLQTKNDSVISCIKYNQNCPKCHIIKNRKGMI